MTDQATIFEAWTLQSSRDLLPGEPSLVLEGWVFSGRWMAHHDGEYGGWHQSRDFTPTEMLANVGAFDAWARWLYLCWIYRDDGHWLSDYDTARRMGRHIELVETYRKALDRTPSDLFTAIRDALKEMTNGSA